VTGIDGKPIQVQSNQTFDSRKLTAEQREHLRDIMKAALTANLQSNAEDAELVDDDDEE
jgi:Spy/CpxP family protein refolding chaperone